MLDLLSDYLNTAASPEDKHHIAVADRVLERTQLDYEHVIEELLALDESADSDSTLTEIMAVYRTQLFYLLQLHAVDVSDGVTLLQLAEIVNGLLDLDNYDNPQKLIDMSDEDAPPLEKFCVMLEQVTRYTADELLQMVEEVADGFFVRLKSVNQSVEHEDENLLNDRRARIFAYRKYLIYLESIAAPLVYLDQLLRVGINPSLPYSMYANLIDKQEPLSALPVKTVARELFGAALISEDGYGNPGETVKESLEQYIPDPTTVSTIMVEIRTITMGYKP